ncbi:bile acid:sodium symporter family protein [Corynebacterium pelargi]|uniref:Uncharacterized protein n=1 Tax=Corynebacterium pelargi TaxID=1471400 RepID=A0A410WBX6_9CORY|nr:bile acid:sodium symporter family protein [Corynebacterium pelargi]QAU53445.1 hypothetical protein CPELA_11015 [Corynebacterium pelargi]GGG81978.1 secondary Na+/bile acid symporter, bile acid:Na+ symporter (BASS) family protein [Corynebacterium pelargi]
MRRISIDPLIVLILSAVLLAIVFPVRGQAAEWFRYATDIAIAALFFLYGARLSTREALEGLKHWRLHLTILAFTFVLFPLIGIALQPLGSWFGAGIAMGLMYLTLVPSTVQSSVAFTSIAKGNVAGAIVSASLSNMLGVFLTPILVMALMTHDGSVHVDTSVFIKIATQLLLPFVLGQLLRPIVGAVAATKGTKVVDRGSITMVVYSAFSQGMVAGIWASIGAMQIIALIVLSAAIVALMLWLSKLVAKKLHFGRGDRIAIQFCGSKKSLASGLPMAAVIFGGAQLSLLILPLMIFHQVQLIMCSWYAQHLHSQKR